MRRPTIRHARCRAPRLTTAGLLVLAACGAARAQDASGQGLTVVPTFGLTETLTNNFNLSSTNRQSESITQISPGVQISKRSGRVSGSLNYSLNQLLYARNPKSDNLQNTLAATLAAELIQNHAFFNANASITQQSISAFGAPANNSGLANGNRSEVSTLGVSPSVRGRLGRLAEWNAALSWTGSHSRGSGLGNATARGANVGLSGGSGLVGWGLAASRQVSSFRAGRTTTDDQGTATLSVTPIPTLRLSANAGREAQDVLTGQRQWQNTHGWAVGWHPTDRTDIEWREGRAYYGVSRNFSFSHRMARSVWSYTDTRGVVGAPNPNAAPQQLLTLYDLLLSICQRTSSNPANCDAPVRAQLQQQGLSGDLAVGGGFLVSGLTLQRSQIGSVAVSGLLTTITFSIFRTATQPLGAGSAGGDLATVTLLRQQGASLGLSQRLTATSTLTATYLLQRTLDAGAQPGNRQRLALLGWTEALGPRTNAGLTLRHTVFDSATNPYQESAVIGTFSMRF
ncbi:MAG: TIGR03016 family PEP-CTERM system-associated outer membrane protein [Burkholderiales bacterium]|nr:TIGR03016 family PEP-CTERM system-associated outer membrane protein [Burkholderiales bacterium]